MAVIHVIPDEWGPFVDIRACYRSLSRRCLANGSLSVLVVAPDEYESTMRFGPDVLAIMWAPRPIPERGKHDCFTVAVYSEAFDPDESKMLPEHLQYWRVFRDEIVRNYDAVFVHTPWMQEQLAQRLSCPVFVMPVGWDAQAMGTPRWETPKHTKILYWGSPAGRRRTVGHGLAKEFAVPKELADATGLFGRGLLGRLDTSAVALYIAHSPVRSFSTWRLWQVASTSATLVAEPGDSWPFEPHEHYCEISPIEIETVKPAARVLLDLARTFTESQAMAKRAHELARKFTVDHVHEAYVLPAFEQIRARG